MEYLDRCYQKDPSTPSREIANEIILVPIKQKLVDVNSIYLLQDEVAVRTWELFDGKNKISDIVGIICAEFDVTTEQAQKDIIEFIIQMENIGGLIKETKVEISAEE